VVGCVDLQFSVTANPRPVDLVIWESQTQTKTNEVAFTVDDLRVVGVGEEISELEHPIVAKHDVALGQSEVRVAHRQLHGSPIRSVGGTRSHHVDRGRLARNTHALPLAHDTHFWVWSQRGMKI